MRRHTSWLAFPILCSFCFNDFRLSLLMLEFMNKWNEAWKLCGILHMFGLLWAFSLNLCLYDFYLLWVFPHPVRGWLINLWGRNNTISMICMQALLQCNVAMYVIIFWYFFCYKMFYKNKLMRCMLCHQFKSKCMADTCSKKGSGDLRNQQRQLASQCLLECLFGY